MFDVLGHLGPPPYSPPDLPQEDWRYPQETLMPKLETISPVSASSVKAIPGATYKNSADTEFVGLIDGRVANLNGGCRYAFNPSLFRRVDRFYHFVGATLRDGRPVPADSVWLEHDGEVLLCKTPWDALQRAPGAASDAGAVLCEVQLDAIERRWRIVRRVDLTEPLRWFARDEARRMLPLWDAPAVVRQYLETGDEALHAAASEAASEAARTAVSEIARWAAAWAVRAAEWTAAGAARMAARMAAQMDAQVMAAKTERFNALAMEALDG